jgi:hypothetical protein
MVHTDELSGKSRINPEAMRIATWQGLRPIEEFDEVEIHPMKTPDEGDPDELWQAVDCSDENSVVAYSVFLHLHSGGIECVRDIRFDPSAPGADAAAKQEAEMVGEQLYDMLRASGMLRAIRYGEVVEDSADAYP